MDDGAPDGEGHKDIGTAEKIESEAGEQRNPLMTPFQRRRMEIWRQGGATGEGD